MALEPFLTLPLRSCRDLVHVRQRARQVAQLLQFSPREVIGIAAAAFVVAQRAKKALGRAYVCFAILDRQLRIFAKPMRGQAASEELMMLQKPIPPSERAMTPEDIFWLIRQVQLLAPTTLADELERQNAEILELLLQLSTSGKSVEPGSNPSAA